MWLYQKKNKHHLEMDAVRFGLSFQDKLSFVCMGVSPLGEYIGFHYYLLIFQSLIFIDFSTHQGWVILSYFDACLLILNWMPNTVIFMLMSAGYIIPIDILELCSLTP